MLLECPVQEKTWDPCITLHDAHLYIYIHVYSSLTEPRVSGSLMWLCLNFGDYLTHLCSTVLARIDAYEHFGS